jgi:tRNA pseudouridine55 synthase
VIGRGSEAHGILIVDKPVGPTSHDAVAQIRRALGTRAVGHAGTLDPAASGVLVVAVGAATKLIAYLVARSKRYLATIRFGVSTSTDDAEGDVLAEAPLPDHLVRALTGASPLDIVERALDGERSRREQVPPQFSAIKHRGRPAHQLARRGEHVPLAPRSIEVHQLTVAALREGALDVSLHVSKGYYVRSLARDLGQALGVPAHLSALRRIESDPFTLGESIPLDAPPESLMRSAQTLPAAVRRLFAVSELTSEGARRAHHGQRLFAEHFASAPAAGVSAWFGPLGDLVALGHAVEPDQYASLRVFSHLTSSSAT